MIPSDEEKINLKIVFSDTKKNPTFFRLCIKILKISMPCII